MRRSIVGTWLLLGGLFAGEVGAAPRRLAPAERAEITSLARRVMELVRDGARDPSGIFPTPAELRVVFGLRDPGDAGPDGGGMVVRRQLEALEDDRYGDLPGLVFAKGFLRCCARALDLDPEAVIGLLYEREREQLRAKRRETSGVGPQVPAEFGKHRRSNRASRWLATQLDRLPSAQILMWLVVALLVAIIVLVAFTMASGQAAEALQIRS